MNRPTVISPGTRFGRLTVIERDYGRKGKAFYRCRCDCGGESVVPASKLTKGKVKSCGHFGSPPGRNSKHSHLEGYKRSSTYNSWLAMLARCLKPTHKSFHHYGGIGVKVCDRWLTFANFLEDMGERPANRTLDRYPDPAGGYEPGNCRWATGTEQRLNRRT